MRGFEPRVCAVRGGRGVGMGWHRVPALRNRLEILRAGGRRHPPLGTGCHPRDLAWCIGGAEVRGRGRNRKAPDGPRGGRAARGLHRHDLHAVRAWGDPAPAGVERDQSPPRRSGGVHCWQAWVTSLATELTGFRLWAQELPDAPRFQVMRQLVLQERHLLRPPASRGGRGSVPSPPGE